MARMRSMLQVWFAVKQVLVVNILSLKTRWSFSVSSDEVEAKFDYPPKGRGAVSTLSKLTSKMAMRGSCRRLYDLSLGSIGWCLLHHPWQRWLRSPPLASPCIVLWQESGLASTRYPTQEWLEACNECSLQAPIENPLDYPPSIEYIFLRLCETREPELKSGQQAAHQSESGLSCLCR